MTDRYVDSNTGDNGDNGTTQALAWATIEYALESGALDAGYNVWVRRTHGETLASDITCAYDGDANSPIQIIGWPRPAIPDTTITEGDWTNGGTTVDNIVGITCDREQHQGRYATAPDGEVYLITRVIDANTVIINREYVGGTVTGVDGKFQIEADEDFASKPADVDGWDGDAIDLPVIDFDSGAFDIDLNQDHFHVFKNLEFLNGGSATGILRISYVHTMAIGCLFKHSGNTPQLYCFGHIYCKRCIFEGSGSGSSQRAGYAGGGGFIHLRDCAVYNMGDNGMYATAKSSIFLENVNIGVEVANGDDDIEIYRGGGLYGRDVKLGGSNGDVAFSDAPSLHSVKALVLFENYGKILGAHKAWFRNGTWEKVAVSGETPNKKVSDDVLKLTCNRAATFLSLYLEGWVEPVLVHEIEADASSKTYKYWVYNDTGETLNDTIAKENIWLVAEYVSAYDDTSEYIIKEAVSTELDILNAADADDWDYLQVTVEPTIASKVRLSIYIAYYNADAADNIFIDPAVVIS